MPHFYPNFSIFAQKSPKIAKNTRFLWKNCTFTLFFTKISLPSSPNYPKFTSILGKISYFNRFFARFLAKIRYFTPLLPFFYLNSVNYTPFLVFLIQNSPQITTFCPIQLQNYPKYTVFHHSTPLFRHCEHQRGNLYPNYRFCLYSDVISLFYVVFTLKMLVFYQKNTKQRPTLPLVSIFRPHFNLWNQMLLSQIFTPKLTSTTTMRK